MFKAGDGHPMRDSLDNYYMTLLETKDFNVLIDNNPFFDQPIKANQKRMKNLSKYQELMIMHQETY